jgi:hypothetical protein
MNIHIMRGVSGSGKSTYAKTTWPEARVVSADTFFYDQHGVYMFDPAKLGEAHGRCLREFADACASRRPFALRDVDYGVPDDLVVDNTNISVWEVAPYYSLALAYGHTVEVVRIDIPSLRVAAARNVHGVPYDGVRRQYERLAGERLPPFWVERFVETG